ncbi:MAG TPA: amidohydrolase family protein [bacterium]|nr:amidohydrolase family protein [bacterium]
MASPDLLVVGGAVLTRGDGETRSSFKALDMLVHEGRVAALEPAGRISAAKTAAAPAAARDVLDASGRLVLPGLVNAHSHSYGQVCRHCMNDDTLEPWLSRAMAYARGMTPADSALAARMHAADALRNGITLLLDHARLAPDHVEGAIGAYETSGLRVALAPQIGDRTIADSLPVLDPALHAVIAAADRWQPRPARALLEMMAALVRRTEGSRFVRTLAGPSTAERCTPELLAALSALAREHGLAVHTHLLESRVQRRGGDPLAVLESAGLLGPRTTLAHCVHLTARDRARIAASGATVVHNPLSNLATGAGYFDLRAALDASVPVAFGTDGFNCGGSQDWLGAIRTGVTLRRPDEPSDTWVRPADVWTMATEDAATALGFGDVAGRLDVGLGADFIVVDPAAAGCYAGPDWLDQLVFAGFGDGLERVYVAGRLLVERGRPVHIDERALADEAASAYERLERTTRDGQAVAAALKAPLRRLSEIASGRARREGPENSSTKPN